MKTLDADVIMEKTTPKAHQTAPEMQPYGHIVRMPIALSETACKDAGVDSKTHAKTQKQQREDENEERVCISGIWKQG